MDFDNTNLPSDIFGLHLYDSRFTTDFFTKFTNKKEIFDVIITSPPYHDIISYEKIENQIGYGQKYEEYLQETGYIFRDIYNFTKNTGSLWMIVNTFTRNKELIMLPYDIANEIKKYGWILKDIIIWKKDKTNPWYKKGQMRKIYEYLLFFVKSDNFIFNEDLIREVDPSKFKEWWVKFPERYNVKGMLPTNIWEYSIPVQGNWGFKDIKHKNPLPINLIKRIIKLTTNEKNIVFDPFSGSGVVLSVANLMNRNYIGFELNPNYVKNFKNVQKIVKNIFLKEDKSDINKLQNLLSIKLINLRLLKYAKVFYNQLIKLSSIDFSDLKRINSIFIFKKDNTEKSNFKGFSNIYIVYNDNKIIIQKDLIEKILKEKSLTRFQIYSDIFFVNKNELYNDIKNKYKELWLYSNNCTHKYTKSITLKEWYKESDNEIWFDYYYNFVPPIISDIMIFENIKRTWSPKSNIMNNKRLEFIKLLNIES